jgi:hypothetical protein
MIERSSVQWQWLGAQMSPVSSSSSDTSFVVLSRPRATRGPPSASPLLNMIYPVATSLESINQS